MARKRVATSLAFIAALAGSVISFAPSAYSATTPASEHAATGKHRLIVLTDIGADPDDTESLVRLMLYSDEIDIEGLIATTSVWMKTNVNPDSIREVIGAYGQVQGNLLLHDKQYPQAKDLLERFHNEITHNRHA